MSKPAAAAAIITTPTNPTAPSTTSPIVISRVIGGCRTVWTMIGPGAGEGAGLGAGA
jgi:hypothetical protein